MATIPCPSRQECVPCPGFNAIGNFSSERPDPADFFALRFFYQPPGLNSPDDWYNPGGPGSPRVATCNSPISQQEAEDCALRRSQEDPPQPRPRPTFYHNQAQTCDFVCPGGGGYQYTVPAGQFTGRTLAEANVLAASYCRNRGFIERNDRCVPTVETTDATDIGEDFATINGLVNPAGQDAVAQFEWGTTTAYGNVTPPVSIPAGVQNVGVHFPLTELDPGTYHFRILASSSAGLAVGGDKSFEIEEQGVTIAVVPLDQIYDLSPEGVVSGAVGVGTFRAAWYLDGVVTLNTIMGAEVFGNCYAANAGATGGYQDLTGGGINHGFYETEEDGLTDLGSNVFVRAINADGLAACDTAGGAAIYTPIVGFTGIGASINIEQQGQSPGRCYNENGQVLVYDNGTSIRYRWDGSFHSITPGGLVFGVQGIKINGVNHSCGNYLTGGVAKCFINTGGASAAIPHLVGSLDMDCSDMNNSDTIVGEADNGIDYVAFMYNPMSGTIAVPAIPGTTFGFAGAINNSGHIVGDMGDVDDFGFLYKDGVTHKLIDILPFGTGWTEIGDALFINDNRQIVGTGIHNGVFSYFILKYPSSL